MKQSKLIIQIIFTVLAVQIVSFTIWWGIINKHLGEVLSFNAEATITEFISTHPEAIINSVSQYNMNNMILERNAAAEKARQMLKENINLLEQDKISPFAGNPNGKIVLISWYDNNCSYCKRSDTIINKIIEDNNDVKVIYRELPILGVNSELISKTALSVYKINPPSFIKFHDKVMKTKSLKEDNLDEIVKELGIDVNAVKEVMESDEIAKMIRDNREMSHKIGIRGTPSFIIGGELIPESIDLKSMQDKIDEVRKNLGGNNG